MDLLVGFMARLQNQFQRANLKHTARVCVLYHKYMSDCFCAKPKLYAVIYISFVKQNKPTSTQKKKICLFKLCYARREARRTADEYFVSHTNHISGGIVWFLGAATTFMICCPHTNHATMSLIKCKQYIQTGHTVNY